MHISDCKGRIAALVHDYSYALESIGYEHFPSNHPKIATEHIFDKLKPARLQTAIQHEFVVREAEKLKEKDFFKFVDVLMRKAAVVSESIRSASVDTGAGDVRKRFKEQRSDPKPEAKEVLPLREVQPSSS